MAGKDERDGIASATNPMRNLHFDVDGRLALSTLRECPVSDCKTRAGFSIKTKKLRPLHSVSPPGRTSRQRRFRFEGKVPVYPQRGNLLCALDTDIYNGSEEHGPSRAISSSPTSREDAAFHLTPKSVVPSSIPWRIGGVEVLNVL